MPVPKELIIYCDESVSQGSYFSNFYGGALVSSDHVDEVRTGLAEKKKELNLFGEVKWNKITWPYADKYIALIDAFFDLVEHDKVKLRIMFTQNQFKPRGLTKEQIEDGFFILYYLFIKHGFGLEFCNTDNHPIRLRLYLDQLPDTKEKAERFRRYISSLSQNPTYRHAKVTFPHDAITAVTSHDHDILQCLDIVLGSMQFRLNDKHLEKPVGEKRRGKRTRAKERVYKHINSRIQKIYKNFNIGISTGQPNGPIDRWRHKYRHWLFRPTQSERQAGMGKRKKR